MLVSSGYRISEGGKQGGREGKNGEGESGFWEGARERRERRGRGGGKRWRNRLLGELKGEKEGKKRRGEEGEKREEATCQKYGKVIFRGINLDWSFLIHFFFFFSIKTLWLRFVSVIMLLACRNYLQVFQQVDLRLYLTCD